MSKTYIAFRGSDGIVKALVNDHPLAHVVCHSPTGFEFGYGGSGPSDLALSILANYFGEQLEDDDIKHGKGRCFQFYQRFKWHFVAPAQGDTLIIESKTIDEWLTEIERNASLIS